jgi:hypothetical protein
MGPVARLPYEISAYPVPPMRRKPLVASLIRTRIQPQYLLTLVGQPENSNDPAACFTDIALECGDMRPQPHAATICDARGDRGWTSGLEVLTLDASSFTETLDDAGPWDMLRHATVRTMQQPIRATCMQRPHKELRRYLFQEINGTV